MERFCSQTGKSGQAHDKCNGEALSDLCGALGATERRMAQATNIEGHLAPDAGALDPWNKYLLETLQRRAPSKALRSFCTGEGTFFTLSAGNLVADAWASRGSNSVSSNCQIFASAKHPRG